MSEQLLLAGSMCTTAGINQFHQEFIFIQYKEKLSHARASDCSTIIRLNEISNNVVF